MVLQGVDIHVVLEGVTGCHTVVQHGVVQCYRVLRGVTWC